MSRFHTSVDSSSTVSACVIGFQSFRIQVISYPSHFERHQPVPIAQMVERPLWEREVVGSIPGRAIPKALKMVPVAILLGAQHYKANTGSPLTHF